MRARTFLCLCFALAGAGCSFGGPDERRMLANGEPVVAPGPDAYGEGKLHLLNGNYGLAVRPLRAALRNQPGSPEILNALAVVYENLGRRDLSQLYFAQALAADPGSVQTLNNIARSLMQSGSASLAGTYLERAAAFDPQNPIVRSNLELIVREPTARPAEGIAHAAARGADRPIWIERTAPMLQTLVTRPGMAAENAVMDDAMLPLISFATVSFTPDSAASGGSRIDVEPPVEPAAAASDRKPFSGTLAIANGNGRTGMAGRTGTYLESKGWKTARLLNADHFSYARTAIIYRTGFASTANDLAAALPVVADLSESAAPEADVLIRIGRDLLAFDRHHTEHEVGGRQ
jgi:LytR cell envelope-related transcriptional attenuator/Tetratricopeptide repeat